jgi:hypothetical protein
MHVSPFSFPIQHGHPHKTDAAPGEAAGADGAGEVGDAVRPATAGGPAQSLSAATAFDAHVAATEGDGAHGGHATSPAMIARQLIAGGLSAGLAAQGLSVSDSGGHQPFGQIVSQVARGLLSLDDPTGDAGATVPDGTDDGPATAAVAGDGEAVPAEDDTGAVVPAEDDTGAVVPAEDDTGAVGDATDPAPGPALSGPDAGSLTEALLDILGDEGTDPATVSVDTTGEEIV